MNWASLKLLFVHEMRMVLRSRRTIVTSLVLPAILMPMLILGARYVQRQQAIQLDKTTFQYAITGPWADQVRRLIERYKTAAEFRELQSQEENPARSGQALEDRTLALLHADNDGCRRRRQGRQSMKTRHPRAGFRVRGARHRRARPSDCLSRKPADCPTRGRAHGRYDACGAPQRELCDHDLPRLPFSPGRHPRDDSQQRRDRIAGLRIESRPLLHRGARRVACRCGLHRRDGHHCGREGTRHTRNADYQRRGPRGNRDGQAPRDLDRRAFITFTQVLYALIYIRLNVIQLPANFAIDLSAQSIAQLFVLFVPLAAAIAAALLIVSAYAKDL